MPLVALSRRSQLALISCSVSSAAGSPRRARHSTHWLWGRVVPVRWSRTFDPSLLQFFLNHREPREPGRSDHPERAFKVAWPDHWACAMIESEGKGVITE